MVNKQQNAIIMHHSADIDGFSSAAISIKFLEDLGIQPLIRTIPVNYGSYNFKIIKKKVRQYPDTWIFCLDFSFYLDEMMWLVDNSRKLFWMDHHPTIQQTYRKVVDYLNKNFIKIYNKVKKDIFIKKQNYIINMDFENKNAANKLTFLSLFDKHSYSDNVVNFIDNLSKIDLMKIEEQSVKNLCEFIHKIPWKNYQVMKKIIFEPTTIFNNQSINDINNFIDISGKFFIKEKKSSLDKKKSKFKKGVFKNYNVVIINNTDTTRNSEILKTQLKNSNVDISLSYFDDLNRNLRFFSWRSSKPNIDVGRICSQLKNANGGGHKNSAGCYMSLENGINFVKQITNY